MNQELKYSHMKCSLIIFDCDGVLVDSEGIANRLLSEYLGRLGLDYSLEKTIQTFMGRSMAACLADIEAELGRKVPASFVAELQAETFKAFERELKPVAGVIEVLDELERQGIKTCVASSGSHQKLRLTLGLTGLLTRFAGRIFSATEVKRGKPQPDLFLYAASQMGVAPETCVVIEDSLPGVTGAVAAGMTVFGYAARSDKGQLAAAGARIFDDMRKLPDLLSAPSTISL